MNRLTRVEMSRVVRQLELLDGLQKRYDNNVWKVDTFVSEDL
jgi:hypothetical protein